MKNILHTDNKIESPEDGYLYITQSQLTGAGNGLFTAISIYKGEEIALFRGEHLSEKQAALRIKKGFDKYFINMPGGSILDSMHTKCFAKYANDTKGGSLPSFKNNSKIALDENEQVCLIATRNIRSGEEIFCGYGKRYWAKHG